MTVAEAAIERVESAYADNPGVPRYFNSYAERVVYNRLFATDGECTVLIPDNLFYAHTELADLLSQLKARRPRCRTLTRWWRMLPLTRSRT